MSFTSKIGSLASRAYGWSAAVARAVDQYFEYVTLLLPGNGTNGAQNNTFLDGSTNNFTITRNGNTTQGTFSPFSQTGWGNYTAGSVSGASRIDVAGTSGLFGTNVSYTIEGWFNFITPSVTDNTNIIATNTNTYPSRWVIDANVTSSLINLRIITESNAILYSGSTVSYSLGSWVHLAIVNDNAANTLTFYINGQAAGTRAKVSLGSYATLNLLNQYGVASAVPFYASNFRITNGQALYSTNFTPSTVPLTTTSQGATAGNVALLTFQSNRFVDNSSSPKTLTVNGSNSVVAFSPFNPTASWSAATYGGSGYFDGSLDYLSVAASTSIDLASSDFTIECWAYPGTQTNAVDSVFGYGGFTTMLYRNGTTWSWEVGNGSSANYFTITATVTPNAWQHIALTRSGNTFTFWINGSSAGTNSTANAVGTASKSLTIGYNNTSPSAQYFTGYISNFRIVKGTAVYTSAFTPPTAPLTAITNTSLLLNFTNAGIHDATSKNDLETVGSASIVAPTPSKWGSGSIYIPNTASTGSNKITAPNTGGYAAFGTGDFTIEAWFYLITLPSGLTSPNNEAIFGCGNNGPLLAVSGNAPNANKVVFAVYGGTLTIFSTNTVSAGVWYNVAVSRASGTTRMYINGNIEGTSTTVEAINASNTLTIGQDPVGNNQAFNGYINDLRITKGYARYVTGTGGNANKMVFNGTNDLALPTAAFPTL